mmetsp:Transcript_59439/g.173959  ORF Transcript_59439/g.173959 Transcript_59439/m.173959 type:complete len:691 (-) Transcript_59439:192-2264(-)
MSVDPTRPSPLSHAVRAGDVAEVAYLLRTRADPNRRDETGETCLFEAAVVGSYAKTAVLLLGGCDARHRSEVDGAIAADLAADDGLALTIRAFGGCSADAEAFCKNEDLASSFGKEYYPHLLEHLTDLLEGKAEYGQPHKAYAAAPPAQSNDPKTGSKGPVARTSGSAPWIAAMPQAGSNMKPAMCPVHKAVNQGAQKMEIRPEADDFDWGRFLWDSSVERAAFQVVSQHGTALQMAMLQGSSLAAPSAGSLRNLGAGERVHLVLGEHPQHVDERGVRWVRVIVAVDEQGSGQQDGAPDVVHTWWVLWSDLEIIPDGVVSAAHDEAEMDDLMTKTERRGEQLSDEDYQRAWWHRMGVDMGGSIGSVTANDWKLKGYVNRVRSVIGVREVRGSNNKRARTGATRIRSDLPSSQPMQLPPDFYTGDWSKCPTARAVNPWAVKGRVSVVCPTCESRQHFHELLYRNFCTQEWPDKELIVLDTGGAPSRFFSSRASGAAPCWTGDGPPSSLSPAEDPRVLYVHMRKYPLTLGHKRNQLIQLASGEIIAHFDDDNIYAPQYLTAMVEQLRASGSQLVRLEATFSWNPPSGSLLWHSALAFRAETFVHLRGPLRAVAFAHLKCGEEGGLGAVCVIHDLDDTYGVFMHVEHGANISSCSKVGDAWLKGETVGPSSIPNPQLRALMSKYEQIYTRGHR